MKIVKATENQLILREEHLINLIASSLFLGFGFVAMPLFMLFSFGSSVGVESLKCQRVSSDRVDCTLEETVNFGFKQLPPQPLPLVDRAEYKYTAQPGDDDCSAIHEHEFHLIFGGSNRQSIFEDAVQVNCSIGDPSWIQNQVAKLNQFIASEAKAIEIVRDHRFTLSSLAFVLFASGFIAMALKNILSFPLRISWHLDKSIQQVSYWKTTLWRIKSCSYPLTSVSSVRFKVTEDSDNDLVYEAEVVFNSGEKSLDIGRSMSEENILPIARQVAEFVGVNLEEIDERSPSGSPSTSQTSNPEKREQARKLLDYHKAIYSQRHEFIQVSASSQNFPNVDIHYYDRVQTLLEQQGFDKLADIEDVTITQANRGKTRTFIRVMVSRDRRTTAGIYAIPTSFLIKVLQAIGLIPKFKVIDLESGLEDGTFLVTNNLKDLSKSSDVPGIQRQQYAVNTTVDELIAAHTKTLDRLTRQQHPVYVYTYEDAIALQHRMQDRINCHKQSLGYLTPDDIRRAAKPGQGEAAEELGRAIEEIKQEESGDRPD